MSNKKSWTQKETEWLIENISKLPMRDLCQHLGRSERAISLKIFRERIVVRDNILYRMLKKKFVDPANFTPSRDFYTNVKIGQKRFWTIYRGELKLSNEECKRVANYLGLNYKDWVDSLQLDFMEQENTDE